MSLLLVAGCGQRVDDAATGSRADAVPSRTATAPARDIAREPADSRTATMGAGPAPAAPGARADDGQITVRVSARMLQERELSANRIDVDTRDGVVTLSGSVPSIAAKARAAEVAQAVKDVKSVNNQLTVNVS